jgi:hypothetical protein
MQALMTRLSRRACRSACKNKDRGKELFLSNMVTPPGAGFRNSALAGRAAMPRRENWMVIDSLLISFRRGPRPHAGSRISRTST